MTIELSKSELMIVSNAINEIYHGPDAIEDWEFNLRVGAPRIEAEALLDRLCELSRQAVSAARVCGNVS